MSVARFRTPIQHARGLGSAKDGTRHWWMQRVTAIALVPLAVWLVAALLAVLPAGYEEARAWLGRPVPAALTTAFLIAALYHAQLGLQVVVEDYVHHEGVKVAALVAVNLVILLLGLLAVLAVLEVALGR